MRRTGFTFPSHRRVTGSSWLSVVLPFLGVIALAGCVERKAGVKDFPLTIIVAEQLSPNPSDKIPEDIVNLALPLTPECSREVFVPDVRLVRVDLEETVELSLKLEETFLTGVQNFYKATNPVMIERNIRKYLSSKGVGDSFSRPTLHSGLVDRQLATYIESVGGQQTIVYSRNDNRRSVTLGSQELSVRGDIESLRNEIADEICELSRSDSPISYHVIYRIGQIKGKGGASGGSPFEPPVAGVSDADEEYARLMENLYQRGEGPGTKALTDQEWKTAETKFPHDYRFTFERAKLAIYGTKAHHEAFDLLNIAAEKAIENGKDEEMLRRLKEEEDSTFSRLATHREWHHLEEELQHEEH